LRTERDVDAHRPPRRCSRNRAHRPCPVHWLTAGPAGGFPNHRKHVHATFLARPGGDPVIAFRSYYGHGRATNARAPASNDAGAFRFVAIEPVRAPEGCVGRDWFEYRIAQGSNLIKGYRRGDLGTATAEVEKIVVGLNERRIATKGRPEPKPKTPSGAAPSSEPGTVPDAGDG
jgi:hypothetical protein